MKKQATIIFILLSLLGKVSAQTDSFPSKYLSIGSKKTGICFGNSPIYTGVRLNLIDRQVQQVNIINFSLLKVQANQSNGLAIGLFVNRDIINRGLSFAVIGNIGKKRNGIAIGGLFTNVSKINGIGIAGLGMIGDTLNGFFIGGIGVGKWQSVIPTDQINGIAIGILGTAADKVNGLTIGAINGSSQHNGLSIGIFNRTEKLRGVQLGLINYAGNNPKGLRWLPLINMHLGW